NTWEHSYFKKDGLRVLFVLPRPTVDELIPIRINPRPQRLQRVMVGRVEVLTPADEQRLQAAVADRKPADKARRDQAQAHLEHLGRLKDPALRRLLALAGTPQQRSQVEELLGLLAAKK